ncbi:MAG: SET domain-containing protein [Pricia sp.]|nr:SET domain-containing protein [Pricia sp.]
MIHPDTKLAFINEFIGHGVIATKLIPAGTITWVLDDLDMEFTAEQIDKMHEEQKKYIDIYSYRNYKGNYVLCWDHSRFVNHSFNSNCLSTAYDFEVAIRDIYPGEQLTDDYGYLNVENSFEPIAEAGNRSLVKPDDLLHFHNQWDEELKKTFPKIANLRQPLQPFFSQNDWWHIQEIAQGRREMESILKNYCAIS